MRAELQQGDFFDLPAYSGTVKGGFSCQTLETLNLLSALHVGRLGPYWRDPVAFKDYSRALRLLAAEASCT
jgi:hypothetical protein